MEHCLCIRKLKVMFKGFPLQHHVVEAKVIKDLPYSVIAKESRIKLYEGIQLLFCQKIGTDGLNLLWRTAMHCRDGDGRTDVS